MSSKQTSFPSKRMVVVDIPDVSNVRAEFIYNFFTRDERSNDTGVPPPGVLAFPGETFNQPTKESVDFNRRTPRYNWITWSPVNFGNHPNLQDTSIEENSSKIYSEQDFSSSDFCSLTFQDNGLDGKMAFFVRSAARNIVGTSGSSSDVSRLNETTDPEVTKDFIGASMHNPQRLGMSFNSAKTALDNPAPLLKELSGVKIHAQVNSKVLSETLRTVMDDVVSPFQDEISGILDQASAIQNDSRSSRSSTIFSGDDYDFEITNYIRVQAVDTDGFDPVLQCVGYILNKQETLEDGRTINHPPAYIENTMINSYADLRVRYGSSYSYTLSSVAYVEIQAQKQDNFGAGVVSVGFLVRSKPSAVVVVPTVETVPPPPPSDLSFSWDRSSQHLRIMWSFPPNPQRDIKRFQIFRRSSVEEPFQLLKMYDFDDSEIRSPFYEMPDSTLVDLMRSPSSIYFDREFGRDSDYIYAVCCIDAHGMSSNYSMQMRVQFDKFKNKLVQSLVSVAGAPKSYPNIFLNTDTFVDTIRDEGHRNLRVVFNPDYLKAFNNSRNDLGLIKAHQDDIYRLQLINLDLQKQEVVEIKLKDMTEKPDILSKDSVGIKLQDLRS